LLLRQRSIRRPDVKLLARGKGARRPTTCECVETMTEREQEELASRPGATGDGCQTLGGESSEQGDE